jgi:hypothetical protein
VRQELGLIDEDAMHDRVRVVFGDAPVKIVAMPERLRPGRQADARADAALAGAIVESGDELHRRHAAFAVIVGRLQKHGRLAGVHRGVVKIELGHVFL